MRKVVLKWDKASVLERIKKVRFVVLKMTENVGTFPNPSPALADLTTQADDLEAAEAATSDGGKDRTLIRDAALNKMIGSMNLEVLYVQTITLGDPDLTALAGMETQAMPTKWPVPEKPQGFVAKPGEFNGSVYMKCKGTKYKKQYVFEQMVVDAEGEISWKVIQTQGSNRFLLQNLERGKIYTFRVHATNSAGKGPVSSSANSAAT